MIAEKSRQSRMINLKELAEDAVGANSDSSSRPLRDTRMNRSGVHWRQPQAPNNEVNRRNQELQAMKLQHE